MDQTKEQQERLAMTFGRVANDFRYHQVSPDDAAKMAVIRADLELLARTLVVLVPQGRELSSALTKLEEAMFHANAGIARNKPVGNTLEGAVNDALTFATMTRDRVDYQRNLMKEGVL